MDTADFASALETAHVAKALLAAKSAPSGPVATGECLFCEAKQPAPRRWCDSECRDAWEAAERRLLS